jgi:hypothetical protein
MGGRELHFHPFSAVCRGRIGTELIRSGISSNRLKAHASGYPV